MWWANTESFLTRIAGSRETAFLYAISSAGVTFALTQVLLILPIAINLKLVRFAPVILFSVPFYSIFQYSKLNLALWTS